MAITVTPCGHQVFTASPTASGSNLFPSATSVQAVITPTQGHWIIAAITWAASEATGGSQSVTFNVADDAHNWWEPIGAPDGTSPPGPVRVSVWAAPVAKTPNVALISPTGRFQAACVQFFDVGGMGPGYRVPSGSVTWQSGSLFQSALGGQAPSSQALWFTVSAAVQFLTFPVIAPAFGWTSAVPGGFIITSDEACNLAAAWQVTSSAGAVEAIWTTNSGFQSQFASWIGALVVNAPVPAQPSPSWPASVLELGVGAGFQTTADQITWVNTTPRYLGLDFTQGRQFQLAALQGGTGTLNLDNPDGAVLPPGSGIFAGIDAGTPFRLRTYWAGGAWQLAFHGNGTQTSPGVFTQVTSAGMIRVSPGQQGTIGCWALSSNGWSAAQGGFGISWSWYRADATTLISSGSASSNALVQGVVTLSTSGIVTAPRLAAFLAVSIFISSSGPAPASSNVFSFAAVQGTMNALTPGYLIGPGTTVTTSLPWVPDRNGPPVTTPWAITAAGFVQQWPQSWDQNTYRGMTEAVITDAFGFLTANLQPILLQEILNSNPLNYWPLNEPAGVSQASDISLNGTPVSLSVSTSKYGSAGATENFGQNSSAILGAQGTIFLTNSLRGISQSGMWGQLVPSNSFSGQNGFFLSATSNKFPSASGNGFTIEIWFQVQNTAGGGPPVNYASTLFSIGNTGGSDRNVWMVFAVANPGNIAGVPQGIIMYEGFNPPQVTHQVTNVNYYNITTPTHLAVTVHGRNWTAYVNGGLQASGTLSISPPEFTVLGVGGIGEVLSFPGFGTLGQFIDAFCGFLGHVVLFGRVLPQAIINDHYQAGITGMAGDSAPSRIERLLQGVPYLGRRAILQDTGNARTFMASCQDIGGQPAGTALNNVSANTVPGQLWNAPSGDLFYQARSYCWNQKPVWVIGNRVDLGEIPHLGDIQVGYDTLRVLNSIQLTQLDNLDIVTPTGEQLLSIIATSQGQYGTIPYWVTGYLQGDLYQSYGFGPSLFDLANWLGGSNAVPFRRVLQVTIAAHASPLAWQFTMQAAPGDMANINVRSPVSNGEFISVTVRIAQTARQLTFSPTQGVTGTITILADPAPETQVLTLDDPVLGLLNGQNRLAW